MNIDAETGSLQINEHLWVQSVFCPWCAHRTVGEKGAGSGGEGDQGKNN